MKWQMRFAPWILDQKTDSNRNWENFVWGWKTDIWNYCAVHDGLNFVRGWNSLSRVQRNGEHHAMIPSGIHRFLLDGGSVRSFPGFGRSVSLNWCEMQWAINMHFAVGVEQLNTCCTKKTTKGSLEPLMASCNEASPSKDAYLQQKSITIPFWANPYRTQPV
jgi:hypothetical protein